MNLCFDIIYIFIISGIIIFLFVTLIILFFCKKSNKIFPAHNKTLTLVFADISDSTILWEKCSHVMKFAIIEYYTILKKYGKIHNGDIINTEGDNIFIVFDNIINAICWCIDIDSELLETKWPNELLQYEGAKNITNEFGKVIYNGITVHVGIHTGIPICQYNNTIKHYDYYGPVVNKAARIQNVAKKGQIILSSLATYTLMDALVQYNPTSITRNDIDHYEFIINKKKIEIRYNGIYNLKGIEMPERLYILVHQNCHDRYKYNISRISSFGNSVLSQKSSMKNTSTKNIKIVKLEENKLYNIYDNTDNTSTSTDTEKNSMIGITENNYNNENNYDKISYELTEIIA